MPWEMITCRSRVHRIGQMQSQKRTQFPPYTPIEPRCKPKRTYGTHLHDRPHVLSARDGKLQQPARPRRAGGRCARLAVEHEPAVRGVVGRRWGRGVGGVVVLLGGWWRWRDGAAVLLWGKGEIREWGEKVQSTRTIKSCLIDIVRSYPVAVVPMPLAPLLLFRLGLVRFPRVAPREPRMLRDLFLGSCSD